jgi:hypothetical protein
VVCPGGLAHFSLQGTQPLLNAVGVHLQGKGFGKLPRRAQLLDLLQDLFYPAACLEMQSQQVLEVRVLAADGRGAAALHAPTSAVAWTPC